MIYPTPRPVVRRFWHSFYKLKTCFCLVSLFGNTPQVKITISIPNRENKIKQCILLFLIMYAESAFGSACRGRSTRLQCSKCIWTGMCQAMCLLYMFTIHSARHVSSDVLSLLASCHCKKLATNGLGRLWQQTRKYYSFVKRSSHSCLQPICSWFCGGCLEGFRRLSWMYVCM